MPATIDVTIKDGKINIEVSGVDDASCTQLTQALESALGEVEDVQQKPEFYVELDSLNQELYEGDE